MQKYVVDTLVNGGMKQKQLKSNQRNLRKYVHCEVHIIHSELPLSYTVNEKAANECKGYTLHTLSFISGGSSYYRYKMVKL